MDNIVHVESWINALLEKLTAQQRRKLLRDVAIRLRQQQQKNIQQQKNPDGSAFEPRKPQLRAKKGRIKRQMFSKMRTTRYLKTQITGNTAGVEFDAKARRIARIHHYGLRDRVSKKGPEITYPTRQLLGISDVSNELIADLILEHLSR
ncbi:phage virion morphogenesis protein [Citrobacter sp. BDA59-3]|uniref:phage virion morphogenesis protein n=1 Tax=Citrobacter sp. BDA59-3 TaxID=2781952 RepID=UPI00188296DD|nr:phage virion morphogenesis protein [Citrobacter sp. BDA59-3]QOV67799.1 phage virion morphogenesis protein [Citrobacter sp. BDA59-3]